jgi:hypothetical protein
VPGNLRTPAMSHLNCWNDFPSCYSLIGLERGSAFIGPVLDRPPDVVRSTQVEKLRTEIAPDLPAEARLRASLVREIYPRLSIV